MTSLSDEILRQVDGKSSIRPLVGSFVGLASDGMSYVVDVGGGRIPADLGSLYLPEINESVWVWFVDGKPFVMGPTVPKPDRGTVTGVASGIVTMTTVNGDVSAPYTGTTPSAGQVMGISWHGGPKASLLSTSPAGNTPPPDPGSKVTTHSDTFLALDAGSYGSGRWWSPRVYASDSNLGAWFYGSKIANTIPTGASIQRVEIYISPAQISGSAPVFALHGYQTKPGGSPGLSTIGAIGVGPGWQTLPASVGNSLKAGGGSFGIGLNHGGYSIFHSLAEDGYSGALRITSTY